MKRCILLLLLFFVGVASYAQTNKEEAAKLKKILKANHPKDMYKYAEYLLINKPNGFEKDLETAIDLYKKAAEQDYIPALMALADFCVTSDNLDQLYLGFKYLMEACDNLYPTACEILGRIDYKELKEKGITTEFRNWLWNEFENAKDPYLRPNRYKALRDSYRKALAE